ADLLTEVAGTFLAATDAEIYSLRPLGQAISGAADLLIINKHALRGYHLAEEGTHPVASTSANADRAAVPPVCQNSTRSPGWNAPRRMRSISPPSARPV